MFWITVFENIENINLIFSKNCYSYQNLVFSILCFSCSQFVVSFIYIIFLLGLLFGLLDDRDI